MTKESTIMNFFYKNAKFINFFDRAMGILLFQKESMPETQNPFKMVSRNGKTTEWVSWKISKNDHCKYQYLVIPEAKTSKLENHFSIIFHGWLCRDVISEIHFFKTKKWSCWKSQHFSVWEKYENWHESGRESMKMDKVLCKKRCCGVKGLKNNPKMPRNPF